MPRALNGNSAPKSHRRQKLFQPEGPDPLGNVVVATAQPLSLLMWAQPRHRRCRLGLVLSLLVGVRSCESVAVALGTGSLD